MHGKAIFERAPGFELCETPGGYVLYRDGEAQTHVLNATASVILELCDGANSVDAIARILEDGFELDRDISTEIQGCLSMLQAADVIVQKP